MSISLETPYHYCRECNNDYRDHDMQDEVYPTAADDENGVTNPPCNNCGSTTMDWVVPEHDYNYQVWFDYAHQVYRDVEGHVIDLTQAECSNWDFPCPKCTGPAELLSIDAYGEYHECLNCLHDFKVS